MRTMSRHEAQMYIRYAAEGLEAPALTTLLTNTVALVRADAAEDKVAYVTALLAIGAAVLVELQTHDVDVAFKATRGGL